MNKVIDDEGCISQRVATLVGYHGYQNLGDDIFLRVICRWLRESLSIKKCYLSTNSDMTDRLVSGIHVVPFRNPVTSISRMQWIGIFIKAFRVTL